MSVLTLFTSEANVVNTALGVTNALVIEGKAVGEATITVRFLESDLTTDPAGWTETNHGLGQWAEQTFLVRVTKNP